MKKIRFIDHDLGEQKLQIYDEKTIKSRAKRIARIRKRQDKKKKSE